MNDPSIAADVAEQFDRLDELLSLFFDDRLSDEEAGELNRTLLEDPVARTRSFEAAQLHADLYAYFNGEEQRKPALPLLPLSPTGFETPATS